MYLRLHEGGSARAFNETLLWSLRCSCISYSFGFFSVSMRFLDFREMGTVRIDVIYGCRRCFAVMVLLCHSSDFECSCAVLDCALGGFPLHFLFECEDNRV